MERSYPFVDGSTTDAEFSAMFREVFPASVIGGLKVSADSSGLSVNLPTGSGFVRGHYYKNTAAQSLAIDSGGASPRIDTVVLRLEYGTTNSITAQVKKGAAAADPEPPALTQTDAGVFEFALADVYVTASAVTIAAGDVTDRRVMYADAFKALMSWTLAWGQITGKPSQFPSEWGLISGKPSTFPPDAHTHSAADVTSGRFATGLIPHISDGTSRVYISSDVSGSASVSAAIGLGKALGADRLFWLGMDGDTVFTIGQDGAIGFGTISWSQVTGRPTVPNIYVQSSAPSNPVLNDLLVW